MPQISLDWDTVKHAYPKRPLKGPLKAFMDQTPGTPCCVQMSHALSVGGATIGRMSNRRQASQITTPQGRFYYLLAVDEMKWYLEQNYGAGEEISIDDNRNRRSTSDMTDVLEGRTGILVFSDLHYGAHTELWDVDHMHQHDMSPTLFHKPKVLFWDVMQTAVG